jgi:hypothetical protein
MRSIADELAFIGSPVRKEDLILQVLNGLGPDFISFVMTVTTRFEPLNFSKLQTMLLTYESLLLSQTSIGSPSGFYSILTPTNLSLHSSIPTHHHNKIIFDLALTTTAICLDLLFLAQNLLLLSTTHFLPTAHCFLHLQDHTGLVCLDLLPLTSCVKSATRKGTQQEHVFTLEKSQR